MLYICCGNTQNKDKGVVLKLLDKTTCMTNITFVFTVHAIYFPYQTIENQFLIIH